LNVFGIHISKMNNAQLINLIGALALALADAQLDAVQEASGLGTAGCAALIALGHYPELPIRQIAVIAGLTHSVMVRTIDTLVIGGLVSKRPGQDKREALCQLTSAGETLRNRLIEARAGTLKQALVSLSSEQKVALHGLVSEMLINLTVDRDQSDHMCRLCDEAACGADCPVERQVESINGTRGIRQ